MDSTSPCSSFINDDDILKAMRNENKAVSNQAAKCLDSYKSYFFNSMFKQLTDRSVYFVRSEKQKDMEDAYQDAISDFIERIKAGSPTFEAREDYPIRSYIFSIARNKFNYILRKRARSAWHNGQYKESQDIVELVNVLEEMLKKERRSQIEKAIKELEEDCSKILDERYNQELTPKGIAHLHGENANNISQRLLRCRGKLKRILISKYGFPDSFL